MARITAGMAVLGDFRSVEGTEFSGQQPRPDWMAWAQRLAWALTDVLTEAGKVSALLAPAVLVGNVDLTTAELGALRQALGDAIAHREPCGSCVDCDEHPSGLCEDHAEDLDRCDAYGLLAKALGIEL